MILLDAKIICSVCLLYVCEGLSKRITSLLGHIYISSKFLYYFRFCFWYAFSLNLLSCNSLCILNLTGVLATSLDEQNKT